MSARQKGGRTPDGRVWFAQALRGPACLMVVFAHYGPIFLTEQATVGAVALFPPLTGLPGVPWAAVTDALDRLHLSIGHVGVFVFFLVSGFVIPFALQDGRLGGFFVRRFFRLYPTLWVCLAVTVLTLVVHLSALGYALPYDAPAVAGNAFLLSPYLGSRWMEPVLWTLAVEELFYLTAALVAWGGRLADGRVVAAVAAGLTGLALVAGTEQRPETALFWLAFYATFIPVILVGLVFHQHFRGRWSPPACGAAALLLGGCYALALYRGPAAPEAEVYLVSALPAAALFGGLYALRDRLPYWRPLDALSNASYPLYLLHGVAGYVVMRVVFVRTGNYYAAAVVALAGALVMASAVHLLVERPAIRFGRRLSSRPEPAPAGSPPARPRPERAGV